MVSSYQQRRLSTSVVVFLIVVFTGCERNQDIPSVPDIVEYNAHIRPILSDKCFACHGPDAGRREADLRLDIKEAAYAELSESPGRHAIRPGKTSRSEVIRRIFHDDPQEVMPPIEAKIALTEREKRLIERWIRQGAHYEPLWSLIPIEQVRVPRIPADQEGTNEIDAYVDRRLEKEGLERRHRASKETLIRRAAFDLTGLPPTLEEIDTFLADESPDAYERVIDDYLASPAYGERMAADWMDVARYADSDGYLDDKHRDFSPWRDWVIRSFNANLPYDEFASWQIAGDLYPNPTQDQVLATAFNRLHKKNSEAGIVFEEFRVEYVADRTNTFGKAFLGVTMECARCHDHKYDPISQKEYYELFAFFNSTHEIGHAVYGPDQTPGPALLLSSESQRQQIDRFKDQIDRVEKEIESRRKIALTDLSGSGKEPVHSNELSSNIEAALTAAYSFDRMQHVTGTTWHSPVKSGVGPPAVLVDPIVEEGVRGKAVAMSDYNAVVLSDRVGWFDRTDPFSVAFYVYPDTVYEDAMLFTHSEEWRLGLRGYTMHLEDNQVVFRMAHSYPQNAIEVRGAEQLPAKEWTQLVLTYDGSSEAAGVTIYQDGKPVPQVTVHDNLYKGILFTPDIHTYGFKGIQLGHRDKFTPFKKGRIDEFEVYNRALLPLEVDYLYRHDKGDTMPAHDGQYGEEAYWDYYITHKDSPSRVLRKHRKAARDSLNDVLNSIPEIMVMGDLEKPRVTYILERGMYDAPAEAVYPGTPASILSYPDSLPQNRLGLATWLFHPDNPLTARVYVNRIWKMHFGHALVETIDDFGNQGAMPTHPDLLDWLSGYFRDSGWDIKALHKKIMLSATYQQDAAISPDLLDIDPGNTLYARGSSFRLPAEMIRDNALAISGLLVREEGGSSVYPYQPAGLWDELSTKGWRYRYEQEPGDGLYRRSLYTIWKRTSPPPSMLIFDAPDRSTCTVGRTPTSTPLQALVLLNDPQFVEAARKLAERTLLEVEGTEKDVLVSLFRRITGRYPLKDEMTLLDEFYQSEVDTFSSKKDMVHAYLSNGELAPAENLDAVSLAALSVVANALMNTDEGYSRR